MGKPHVSSQKIAQLMGGQHWDGS